VIGDTEEDARQRFAAEREAWRALHEREDQPTPEADREVAPQL
jgi:hypothetical protein